MNLNQPYYIEPRKGKNHIDLDKDWDFTWADNTIEDLSELAWKYKTDIPKSLYFSLYEAGILPHPYEGVNSKLYHWVDEKVWYYRKKFILDKSDFKGNAFLSFDGVAYYCRVWVNGHLLGEHEGMFGGPVCDVVDFLNLSGENEIAVEVKACNYDIKDDFNSWNLNGENTQIVPWNIARDSETSTGDFIVMGIWNRVRLDFVEKLHISRPYMYTKSINENFAELFLEFEIADGQVQELKPYFGYNNDCYSYTRAYDNGLTGEKHDTEVEIRIKLTEPDTNKTAYESCDSVKFTDFEKSLINPKYYELQFFSKEIRLENPRLWFPLGLGEPFLYKVRIEMYCDGALCDSHDFMTGVRTFESRRSAGEKYRTRWEEFRFSVNGRDFFLKGMNWTPIDYLYDINPNEYEWALTLVKNAGIQLLRVWSGGGMPETDTFYDLCDKLGIMVWQDHMIANTSATQSFPQDILESQEAYNIYRIRNHPSLVIHCGGNEFNPYNTNNAASMFVIDRTVRTLDPSKIFHYTTADKGSAHIYRDMEPVWYRHIYKQLPFLAESGIHSFPNYRTIKKLINEKESSGVLPDLSSKEFGKNFPELINHFSEYNPDRIPRMLARASQIIDVNKFTLEDICEATQVQAYEFYQLMIQSMRENYPVCGGVMPWVFKRPWTTTAIQTVDGMGLPTYPYYAVKNSYSGINICLCQQWSVTAPYEEIPVSVKIFNETVDTLEGSIINVTIYSPDMSIAKEYKEAVSQKKTEYNFESFKPDDTYTDKSFLICADITRDNTILSRATYFVKCISELADSELYKKYRSEPTENLFFENGGQLKNTIIDAKRANLEGKIINTGSEGRYIFADIEITNNSDVAVFPVTVETQDENIRFFLSDNFFLMKAGECKKVRITFDADKASDVVIKCWNGEEILVKK